MHPDISNVKHGPLAAVFFFTLAGIVIAPEKLHPGLIVSITGQGDRAQRLTVSPHLKAPVFNGLAAGIHHVAEHFIRAGSVLQAQVVHA